MPLTLLPSLVLMTTGLRLAANGAAMLIDPDGWLRYLPFMWRTAVANAHLLRDVDGT